MSEKGSFHNKGYSSDDGSEGEEDGRSFGRKGSHQSGGSCVSKEKKVVHQRSNSKCVNIPITDDPFDKLFGGASPYFPVRIDRPVVHQLDLYSKLKDEVETGNESRNSCCSTFSKGFRRFKVSCKLWKPSRWLQQQFPIFDWLLNYNWKENITADLAAGFTVAVMHVPQGMAYALLADIPPIVGIYMAFFPIFVYVVMGASRHVSMGTFAVICLMTGKVVNAVLQNHEEQGKPSQYTPLQIATLVSLVVGVCQVLMGVFKLGVVSLLLSPSLVGGFTTGAAVHVLTSQVRNFFGIKLPRRNGIFKIPMTYYDIASHVSEANIATLTVSAITVVILTFYNELIKPYVSKKTKIPIPIELLAVITGTLVSYYMNLHDVYGVSIIAEIPTGLPMPKSPPVELIGEVLLDSVVIAFVSYAISISMAKIFAKRHKYKVNPNQELLAHGCSNICGSFFSCAPVSVSLSRSLVQELIGGVTQLASLFSCFILLCVLLWIGPLFEALPNCVLAGIIVVALKGMFLQAKEFPKYMKISKLHGIVWISSFLATVLLDIAYGLAIGMILSTVVLIWRSNKSAISVLGSYAKSDLYVDINSNDYVHQLPGIKIIKYTGNLNFATIERFIELIEKIVHASGVFEGSFSQTYVRKGSDLSSVHSAQPGRSPTSVEKEKERIRWVVLDFSTVSSVGPGSVKALSQLHLNFEKDGIVIYYAGCAIPVIREMSDCGFLQTLRRNVLYPTIHDAVLACQTYDSFQEDKTSTNSFKNI